MSVLVSERIGEFLVDDYRLEYTEYGSGPRVIVLMHAQLLPRRMHDPLARMFASRGYRVVTLDLLGHGGSDKPLDPACSTMTAYGEQAVALLDHLGVERAVMGGTSLGANVTLEVADVAPERLSGMILEMPVLENAVEAALIAFAPLLFTARIVPWSVDALRKITRAVPRSFMPFWAGIVFDTLGQYPAPMAATLHGIFSGRIAPPRDKRLLMQTPALVVGHPHDPIHPAADAAMLADELPDVEFVRAESILEWRARPERLNDEAFAFVDRCFGVAGAEAIRDAR